VQFTEVLFIGFPICFVSFHTLLLLPLCSSWQPFRVASSTNRLSTASTEMLHTGCGGEETNNKKKKDISLKNVLKNGLKWNEVE